MGKQDDEAVRNGLKVFVGGLPDQAQEQALGQHFAKYGHVESVVVCPPKEGAEVKKSPYAFVTFRFAADADCAVVDPQNFPGATKPLTMSFAARKGWDGARDNGQGDPCKIFVGGISDRDSEEEIGDFFSQWGLVALVYRDKANWGFIHYATKEGASRVLEEDKVVFMRRPLEVKKATDSRRPAEDEKSDLLSRAVARHFHKKNIQMGAAPPPMGYYPPGYYPPPGAYPGYPPPGYPPGYSGYPMGYYPPASGYYPPPAGAAFESSGGYYAQVATDPRYESRYQPY